MLPSTQDVLGSMPSITETGWGHGATWSQGLRGRKEDQKLRVTLTTQLVLTTPSYRKPCFVWGFVVVVFMSLVRSLVYFTTTKQLEKWKSVFKEYQSCFLCQLSPSILHPLAQRDLRHSGKEEDIAYTFYPTCPFTVAYPFSVFTDICLTDSMTLNWMFGTRIHQWGNSCCS